MAVLSCDTGLVLFDLVLHELVRLLELALDGRGARLFLHLLLGGARPRLHRLRKLGRVEEVVQKLLHVLGRHPVGLPSKSAALIGPKSASLIG